MIDFINFILSNSSFPLLLKFCAINHSDRSDSIISDDNADNNPEKLNELPKMG